MKGRLAMSLITPKLFSEVADGVTCTGYGYGVSLLREPEAGNPHIRFDERDVEAEHGEASEAPADERAGHR
jgi:hypothetical protein